MLKSWSRPAFCLSLTAALGSLLGGCPVAQTPRVPAENSNTNSGLSNNNGLSNDEDRPIPPVVINGNTTTTTSNSNGAGNANTNGASQGSVFVSVSAPNSSLRTRPGALVEVDYEVVNAAGALQKTELVIARDDDNNAQADGDPVLARDITTVAGNNRLDFDTNDLLPLLSNGFGRFVIGVRATTVTNEQKSAYGLGSVTLDAAAPTGSWITPTEDALLDRNQNYTIQVRTGDNAPHTVRILLDPDQSPNSGNEFEFLPETQLPAGDTVRSFTANLNLFPANTYRFFVIVSDGIDPATSFYAPNLAIGGQLQIAITNRIIGDFDLERLVPANNTNGGILQGFNFNDLAGSSISNVPDLNGDGRNELIVASRFGKAHLIENNGVGFGEAYMIYGSANRIRGIQRLNAVGQNLSGVIFTGIRTPRNVAAQQNVSTRWTKGLSDITVVPDMDGDDLPELVFSFPRAESISLGQTNPAVQHPELFPDLGGMGDLEFDAMGMTWAPNQAQFTRGGIVIVSSHNELLQNPSVLNRKSDRVFDLHEAGQLFSGMSRPGMRRYIRSVLPRTAIDGAPFIVGADCDLQPPDGWDPGTINGNPDGRHGNADFCGDPSDCPPGHTGYPCNPNDPPDGFPFCDDQEDTPGECGDDGVPNDQGLGDGTRDDGREALIERWFVFWDCMFTNQGPGGFHQPWTVPPANPPLANPTQFPFGLFPFPDYPNVWVPDACRLPGDTADGCEVTNNWFSWSNPIIPFPCTSILGGNSGWSIGGNPNQTPTNCYQNNWPGPFLVCPEMPCTFHLGPPNCGTPPPPPPDGCPPPQVDVSSAPAAIWTGFYAPGVVPFVSTNTGETFPTPVGARVLGQKVGDEFGTTLGADGTWLYVSAPERTANDAPYPSDVPSLAGTRAKSGIVYQIRTNASLTPGGITRTQLWMERGTREIPGPNPGDPPTVVTLGWPNVDAEIPNRTDFTMPVPHQYIVENIGSLRGDPEIGRQNRQSGQGTQECPPGFDPANTFDNGQEQDDTDQPAANVCGAYTPYPVGTAGYYMDRTPQIVGPHAQARITYVRALGDINDDGVRDFAVGSERIKENVAAGTGAEVGAVFLVFGRPTGVEGDYLLEQLALDPSNPSRLNGVLLHGASAGEKLGRVFDDAGDFNGDGIDDVIVGSEGTNSNTGEAIIILGSRTLLSPAGGWTPAAAVAAGRAIRVSGANPGDLVGANVAGAGDVDGDGFADVLVAAPGAAGGRGAVYLIYGRATSTPTLNLAQIGTIALPGARFVGRAVGDFIGAGAKTVTGTDPNNGSTTATSRGLARLGDIDGDGKGDFAIGAMLADPFGVTDAGEVYVLYGRGD